MSLSRAATLITAATTLSAQVVINEFLPRPLAGTSNLNQAHQWVELCNAGEQPVSLGGWVLADRGGRTGGRTKALPNVSMPAKGYLVVHIAAGADQLQFGPAGAHVYTGEAPGAVFWDQDRDDLALYAPDGIKDYVAWHSRERLFQRGQAHIDAVTAGIWGQDRALALDHIVDQPFEMARVATPGTSVGRNRSGTDRNVPADFDAHGGVNSWEQTPGAPNNKPVPERLDLPPGQNAEPARKAEGVAKWTVMYYLLIDNNLSEASAIKALEANLGNSLRPGLVNHVILVDRKDQRPRFGKLDPAAPGIGLEEPQELDLAAGDTLADFVARAKRLYPAERYALFMHAHGLGWKGWGPDESAPGSRKNLYDATKPDHDELYMAEFSRALNGQQLDLLVLDSCLMAGVEVAYQLRNVARYLVASEEISYVGAIPYGNVVLEINANPDMDGKAFGRTVVDLSAVGVSRFAPSSFTSSLIDLSQVSALVRALDDWGRAMAANMEVHNTRNLATDNAQIGISRAHSRALRFLDDNFIDIGSLAAEILRGREIPDCMKTPIPAVLTALNRAVAYMRNGFSYSRASGLHIYFPENRTRLVDTFSFTLGALVPKEPFDHPSSRLVDANTGRVSYSENHYPLPFLARDVEVESIALLAPQEWTNRPVIDFDFVRDSWWDEFLDRYYHPVAEAYAERENQSVTTEGGGACRNAVDVVRVPVGGSAFFRAEGSSDADMPAGVLPKYFFWDKDANLECTGQCTYPHQVPNGAPAHVANDNIDAGVDVADTRIDDVDSAIGGTTRRFEKVCESVGRSIVTLHVWDDNHEFPFHDTRPTAAFVHPQSDADFAVVECFATATNVGVTANDPYVETGSVFIQDYGAFGPNGEPLADHPVTVLVENILEAIIEEVFGFPAEGRFAAARGAGIPAPPGVPVQVRTNKRGFFTISFKGGAAGPGAITLTFAGRPPVRIPITFSPRLAPLADEVIIAPPTGPLTVGQDYTLNVEARRNGAPLPDAIFAFTNPPGSTGTAIMRNGTIFRGTSGSQSRTGATGRTNVVFRPAANGPVEILVRTGTLVRLVTMEATGGPASVPDRIQLVEAPAVSTVDTETAVTWQVKSLERLMAGVAVQVAVTEGQVVRQGVTVTSPLTIQTDANGLATFRFTSPAIGTVALRATVAGVTLPSAVLISIVRTNPGPGPLAPPPTLSALNHGASGSLKLSPGSLFSVYGQLLARATELTSSTPWPAGMGDVTVTINDVVAPLYYVSPGQLNGQVPYETAVGQATAVIRVAGREPVGVTFEVIPANPGILLFNGDRAVVVNQDFSVNTATNPAPGGTYGTVYFSGIGVPDTPVGTGQGAPAAEPLARSKYPSSIRINGQPVEVLYLGLAPNYPALAQANFRFPSLPPGDYKIVISVNGVDSNEAVISIR